MARESKRNGDSAKNFWNVMYQFEGVHATINEVADMLMYSNVYVRMLSGKGILWKYKIRGHVGFKKRHVLYLVESKYEGLPEYEFWKNRVEEGFKKIEYRMKALYELSALPQNITKRLKDIEIPEGYYEKYK